MSSSRSFTLPASPNLPLTFAGLVLVLLTATPLAAQTCGDNDPATPVPEFRNGIRLWPDGFQPAVPDTTLPAARDSSDYLSTSIPGNVSGHELFLDLDIAGDHVYVAYNAGFQIWNIAGASNAADPEFVAFREGWLGDFESFPQPGEADTFVETIAVHEKANGDVQIVVSAKEPVGPSFWRHAANGTISRISQDQETPSSDVKAVERSGTVYGLVASTDDGVVVYNAESGTRHGTLANDTLSKRHVSFLERDGKLWVAASNGTAIRPKIWEVPNPATPATAIQRFDGEALGSGVRDLELFEHNGAAWLAIVQQQQIKIYNASDCLDSNGCTSLGNAVYTNAIPGVTPSTQYLTFSRATGDTPFLYYGYQANSTDGTKHERLLNLATLGSTNEITEITDGGGVYTDGCGNNVDYWGDYYDGNEHGLRNHSPRAGMFSGDHFYRAARAVFDVHVRSLPSDTPIVTTSVTSAAPFWMSTASVAHPISFTASTQSCSGPGSWTWFDDDSLSSVSGSGTTATLNAGLCAAGDCPDRTLEVWALKSDCSGDPNLVQNRASITVEDPRARITALQVSPGGSVFPVGTVFQASATLNGKSPFTYSWSVRDEGGTEVANGNGTTFTWDSSGSFVPTCAEDPNCLFADGFESGTTTAWSSVVGASANVIESAKTVKSLVPSTRALALNKGLLNATFTLELTTTNLSGTEQDVASVDLVLEPPGPLAFDDPPLTATPLGGGAFQLQANSLNAGEWRWTIQDIGGDQVFDWGVETDVLNYTWTSVGTFTVQVEIRNDATAPGDELAAMTNINVADLGPLTVSTFTVNGSSSPSCNFLALDQVWECDPNAPITFTVETTGGPSTIEFDWDGNGTFEDSVSASGPFVHTYTAIGPVNPQVRAVAGATTSPAVGLSPSLTIF